MGRKPTGRTVILYDKIQTGVDPFGRAVYEDVAQEIENVIIGEPTGEEVVDTLNLPESGLHSFSAFQKAIHTTGQTDAWSSLLISLPANIE